MTLSSIDSMTSSFAPSFLTDTARKADGCSSLFTFLAVKENDTLESVMFTPVKGIIQPKLILHC